ncbi:radical SAM protein [Hymenobacter pini]|uniref:radical SAM protein n=1 Tax=Hymenobacter pini TaxID=2880879 RepID=UPI001CF57EBB|nr:radical SAM protein [Hymenobacter pini]MCA8830706.1 radical SAM protein [Hymenobacter pini]
MPATLIPDLAFLDMPATPPYPVPTLAPTVVASPLRRRLLNQALVVLENGLSLRLLRWPGRLGRAHTLVQQLRRQYYGPLQVHKVAKVAERYYREFQVPGWPSAAHTRHVGTTLHRLVPFLPQPRTLQMAFVAVTKKCPLACAHCFEWDALNQPEKLTLSDLRQLVADLQGRHTSQIFFSGGEPMLRVPVLLDLLRSARPGTDFWVFTSGFHFTLENARQLKAAGLTGVSISLDHHDAARHNAFRGSPEAFQRAIQAAVYAHQVGLVVALTVCATREFTTAENLLAYARLARQLGVTFIHVLEPREVGHFAGQAVDLSPAQLQLLEDFYQRLTYSPEYADWPIVHYYGYHQRRMGCSGAADRFLYVDTDGDVHACPFCQHKTGSALHGSLDAAVEAACSGGCHAFRAAPM